MPCILKVRVLGAAGVLAAGSVFVEVRFGQVLGEHGDHEAFRTVVARCAPGATWNKDFRFEINDEVQLQTEPLQLRLFDGASGQQLGAAVVDLNPLLGSRDAVQCGTFPVVDSVDGICGALDVQAKLLYFGESLTEPVLFFSEAGVVDGYRVSELIGFVDATSVGHDTEYDWTDSFRATKKSNEARQTLLYRLAGQLRKSVAQKVAQMGGNAALGYSYEFDFEQASARIFARAIGTAAKIARAGGDGGGGEAATVLPSVMELLTITAVPRPHGTLLRSIGGVVASRSVHLLCGTGQSQAEREGWLFGLREEIRANAKTLSCTHVLGYRESAVFSQDLLVLSAQGTGVRLDVALIPGSMFGDARLEASAAGEQAARAPPPCAVFHIPFHRRSGRPFEMDFTRCNGCQRRLVPQVLLSTAQLPDTYRASLLEGAPAGMLQSIVCRAKRVASGEGNAELVSDAIPFLEYDLHRQLLCRMRLHGFNAVFGLRLHLEISVGLIVLYAFGTGYFVPALPRAAPLQVTRTLRSGTDSELQGIQDALTRCSLDNRQRIDALVEASEAEPGGCDAGDARDAGDADSSTDSEDSAQAIEIDDDTDEDLLFVLYDRSPVSPGFFVAGDAADGLCDDRLEREPFYRSQQFPLPRGAHSQLSRFVTDAFRALARAVAAEDGRSRLVSGVAVSIVPLPDHSVRIEMSGTRHVLCAAREERPVFNTAGAAPTDTLNLGHFSFHAIREEARTAAQADSPRGGLFQGYDGFTGKILHEAYQCVARFQRSHLSAAGSLSVRHYRHDLGKNYVLVSISGDLLR